MDNKDGNNRNRVPLPPGREPRPGKNIMMLFLAVSLMAAILLVMNTSEGDAKKISYSEFKQWVSQDKIEKVNIVARDIIFHTKVGGTIRYTTYIPYHDDGLLKLLQEKNVEITGQEKSSNTFLSTILGLLPWVIVIFFVWFLMVRQIQGQGNKAMSFGKSRARLFQAHHKKITFNDVAGVEEAKQELTEIIEFLTDRASSANWGRVSPKG
jgi:cell division protease FtsH